MRTDSRREQIAALVATRGEVSVEEIATLCDASLETIRRDLVFLQDAGALLKIHGGAKRAPSFIEGPFQERMNENRAAKQVIARKLAAWMSTDQIVFIDTGSTTLIAAETLSGANSLTVVTNSLKIAGHLAARRDGPRVMMLGGQVDGDNGETIGSQAIEQIKRLNADCAIVTVGTLSDAHGACDYNLEEAEIARAMISQADRTIVLADQSKFDRKAAHRVADIGHIDVLISDVAPGGRLGNALAKAGVHVL